MSQLQRSLNELEQSRDFIRRHIGPSEADKAVMLEALGVGSIEALIEKVVPTGILSTAPLALGESRTEPRVLSDLHAIAAQNKLYKSMIGMGYYNCYTPTVILRNILENPAWYTSYTPYQPEISQGRLEAILNFQTMVMEFTGMEIANSSLLDEATAAAEAMTFCQRVEQEPQQDLFRLSRLPSSDCPGSPYPCSASRNRHRRRRSPRGSGRAGDFRCPVQYPASNGEITTYLYRGQGS